MPRISTPVGGPTPDEILVHVRRCLVNPGWAVTMVGGSERAATVEPPYAYTTGLWQTFQHPELMLIGLEGQMAYTLLNNAGRLIANGQRLRAGTVLAEPLIANVAFSVRAVALPERGTVGSPLATRLLHPEGAVPHFQLVWPNRHGAYPPAAGARWPHQPLLPALTAH